MKTLISIFIFGGLCAAVIFWLSYRAADYFAASQLDTIKQLEAIK
jgi:hypothetical protein